MGVGRIRSRTDGNVRRRILRTTTAGPFPEVRTLYLDRNCILWGIPYLMRSEVGQTPRHLQDAGHTEGWVYLEQPEWIGLGDQEQTEKVRAFREMHKGEIADMHYPGAHLVLPGKEATQSTVERLADRYRRLRSTGQCRWFDSDLGRTTGFLTLELEEFLRLGASSEYREMLVKVRQGLAI